MTFELRIGPERLSPPRLRPQRMLWQHELLLSWLHSFLLVGCQAGFGKLRGMWLRCFLVVPSFVLALLRFFCVFCLHECFQAGQVRAPESTVVLEPGVHSSQWFGIELINAVASFAMFAHQMRPTQQSQVLRDCRTRNWEGSRDVARWLASPPQQIENRAPRWIGQGPERRFRRICNRTVSHDA